MTSSLEGIPAPVAVERLAKSLSALDPDARLPHFIDRVTTLPPPIVVRLLGCALRESALHQSNARIVVDVCTAYLASENVREALVFVWRTSAATLEDQHVVAALAQRQQRDAPLQVQVKGTTLGHRRGQARLAHGKELDRLLLDPDPVVIERVLQNQRVTEAHVVRLCSRKDLTPPLVNAVLASPFNTRPAVRRALAVNARTDEALVIRLLSSLPASDVRAIGQNTSVRDAIRAAAVALRPAR